MSTQVSESAFRAPQGFEAGLVKLDFNNTGQQPHHRGHRARDLGPSVGYFRPHGWRAPRRQGHDHLPYCERRSWRRATARDLGHGAVKCLLFPDSGHLNPRAGTRVINDSPQIHGFVILRLELGKREQDVLGFFSGPSGPPPLRPAEGTDAYPTGTAGERPPESFCGELAGHVFRFGSKTGQPRLALAMVRLFTVE